MSFFFTVSNIVVRNVEKFDKLSERCCESGFQPNLHLLSGEAEVANGRVCSDGFLRGTLASGLGL